MKRISGSLVTFPMSKTRLKLAMGSDQDVAGGEERAARRCTFLRILAISWILRAFSRKACCRPILVFRMTYKSMEVGTLTSLCF